MAPREHEPRGAFLILLLCSLVLGDVFAQDFADAFRPGRSGSRINLEGSRYADTEFMGETLETSMWRARASTAVASVGTNEYTVGVEVGELNLSHSDPRLSSYRTLQGQLGWRSTGESIRAFNVSYGSASDKPFASSRNNVASANYLHRFNSRWWGAINWSNNRNFANNVPIPGFFYVAELSREETLLLGLPFVVWRKRYANGLQWNWVSFIPWNHQLELAYFWGPFTGAGVFFEHRPQQYLRDDREDRRERLFYVENKFGLTAQGAVIPRVLQWRAEIGAARNRRVFEARNFSQEKKFLLELEDAGFASVQMTSNF